VSDLTAQDIVEYYLEGLGVSDERVAALAGALEGDLDGLRDLSLEAGAFDILEYPYWDDASRSETKYGPTPTYRWSAAFLLHVPYLLGKPCNDPEVRGWAIEFLSKFERVFGRPGFSLESVLGSFTRLAAAGVPVSYFRSLSPNAKDRSVDEVVKFWTAGVPVEYALIVRGDHD
jgi:hypothetical protein